MTLHWKQPACGRSPARRRGMVLTLVIVVSFIVIAFAVVMARLGLYEMSRERQAMQDAAAGQAALSVQAWSRLHAADLAAGQPVKLPLAELLPRVITGEATVQRVTAPDGTPMVQCQVRLERAGRGLSRQFEWPLTLPQPPPVPTS